MHSSHRQTIIHHSIVIPKAADLPLALAAARARVAFPSCYRTLVEIA